MSRRTSIFSLSRLFSSSNCRFLFFSRCTSFPDTLPPDSLINMKTFITFFKQATNWHWIKSVCLLQEAIPEIHWPSSNLKLWLPRFITGYPYSRPSSISRVDRSNWQKHKWFVNTSLCEMHLADINLYLLCVDWKGKQTSEEGFSWDWMYCQTKAFWSKKKSNLHQHKTYFSNVTCFLQVYLALSAVAITVSRSGSNILISTVNDSDNKGRHE